MSDGRCLQCGTLQDTGGRCLCSGGTSVAFRPFSRRDMERQELDSGWRRCESELAQEQAKHYHTREALRALVVAMDRALEQMSRSTDAAQILIDGRAQAKKVLG